MTLEDDILRSSGLRFVKKDAPQDATEILTADLLKGMKREAAEKKFFANIGAYVVGKMQDIDVLIGAGITREKFLEYAPRLTATMDYLPSDKGFFEKALDAAMELGYVRLEQQRIILTKGKGIEAFAAVMKKEARYN